MRNQIFLTSVQDHEGPNFESFALKLFSTKYFVPILRNFVNYWKKSRGFFPKLTIHRPSEMVVQSNFSDEQLTIMYCKVVDPVLVVKINGLFCICGHYSYRNTACTMHLRAHRWIRYIYNITSRTKYYLP